MLLEVDDELSTLLGFGAAAHSSGEVTPTKEDLEMTAAAAAEVVTDNPAEAQVAISALAAWNLAMTNSVVQGGAAAAMEVRVEVAAGFGYHGDWYMASKNVTLIDDGHGNSGGGNVVSLSTSFDWQPTGDVSAKLDEPAVADVTVYGAPSAHAGLPVAAAASTSIKDQEEEELVLLQATLCKRATSGVGGRAVWGGSTATGAPAAAAAMQATLTPYTERKEHGRPQQPEGEGVIPPVAAESAAPAGPSRPVVVVSEIEDGEFWRAHEEKGYGRGMDAVNALSRLHGWKPGDWKKRQKRRRKQEEERERQRADRRPGDGSTGTGNRGGAKNSRRRGGDSSADGGRSAWGAVRGAWRAVGQMWRRSVRKFRRGKT